MLVTKVFGVAPNDDRWSWESAHAILDYVPFAGFERTRDQLARLHRRRLIDPPVQGPNTGRGHNTTYPSGTAERMVRIAQLKGVTKQMDELAWRLWWEGFDIEPDLVRGFISKKAARWDEQYAELRRVAAMNVDPEVPTDRDVLEEVFFEHLKTGAATSASRKQLSRGSDLYIAFASLFIDLLQGDLSRLDASTVGLFDSGSDDSRVPAVSTQGAAALRSMRATLETSYTRVLEELDDKQVASAHLVAIRLLRTMASVGSILQDVYGGVGRGRDNIGKSLVALSQSPDEQVLALLLTSSILDLNEAPDCLGPIEPVARPELSISYRDFVRLRFLAEQIPALNDLLEPSLVARAFESSDGAREWHAKFEVFRMTHQIEIEDAMDLDPLLFDDTGPAEPEPEREKSVTSKKKILKRDRRR